MMRAIAAWDETRVVFSFFKRTSLLAKMRKPGEVCWCAGVLACLMCFVLRDEQVSMSGADTWAYAGDSPCQIVTEESKVTGVFFLTSRTPTVVLQRVSMYLTSCQLHTSFSISLTFWLAGLPSDSIRFGGIKYTLFQHVFKVNRHNFQYHDTRWEKKEEATQPSK
ncbi:hypothetical protein BD289DRAFT_440817 [Coniella lustricola]|uniref:Uncharacterized protein n=1 Tax=Coniella lustricola TaxID=2025994 RepID=A0A2T3A073_9PEZI|nr:hypothetical protein BD289DRAFT_440817 [Coniella lustricola]